MPEGEMSEEPSASYADNEEFHTYSAMDVEEGSRGLLLVAGIVLLVVAFAGVLFFSYQQGLKQGIRSAPPMIRADTSPVKVKPENPGGLTIPHQDKRIYDRIGGGGSTAESGIEQLLSPAEEPIDLPYGARSTEVIAPDNVSRIEVLPPPITVPETRKNLEADATGSEKKSTPLAPTPADRPATGADPTQDTKAASGNFVVQVAALRNAADANTRFDVFKAAHGNLVRGLRSDIQRAELGKNNIYYRLRVGYFVSKEAAESLCVKLRRQGQDCLVRSR